MNAPNLETAWDAAAQPLTRRGVLVLRTQRQRDRRRLLLAFGIAAACFMVAVMFALVVGGPGEAPADPGSEAGAVDRMRLPPTVAESAVLYDTAVMPLAPEEASAINAERPNDLARLVPARALRIAADSASGVGYEAALRCLTQAVYYEAASEPDAGQQAVAQVVLNRVRHPAYPNTVCGVVYQGSERVTGCQFSFTCDGSLARIPTLSGWARAGRVARSALAGTVAASVGHATHYHANYVVPYWAPTLDKATTIGAHIFYVIRGFLGSPRAFSGRYDVALEAAAAPSLTEVDGLKPEDAGMLAPLDAASNPIPGIGAPVADTRSGSLISEPGSPRFEMPAPAALRADERAGQLRETPAGSLKADKEPAATAGTSAPPDQE